MSRSEKSDVICRRCGGPLTKELEARPWMVGPFVRDSLSVIGSGVGGAMSGFHAYHWSMRVVGKWIKRPMWLQFLVGIPPVIVFSSVCAGVAGGSTMALTQLASTSYYAFKSSPSQDDKKHQRKN